MCARNQGQIRTRTPREDLVPACGCPALGGRQDRIPSVHRSLSELSPTFDHERYGRLLVLGGDLNTLARAEIGSRTLARDQGVLDRITASCVPSGLRSRVA